MGKLTIWDGDFIPFYCCHVKKGKPEKSLQDCIDCCNDLIKNVNTSIGADSMIMCLTSGKCFRYNIYSEYKANRKYPEAPKWFFETRDYLYDNYKAIIAKNLYEADDLVFIYKTKFEELGYECVIVSPDKDILNMNGTHYNPKENQFVINTKDHAERWKWYQMCVGDPGDGIPGIKGVGKVATEKLLDNKQDIFTNYRQTVFEKYCEIYGEEFGVEMFYKMYKCLCMVTRDDNLELPTLIDLKDPWIE